MKTVYDWLSVGIFAGLLVLFLQRSVSPEPARDSILQYVPPVIGCALANYVGNHGQQDGSMALQVLAIAILVAVVVYTVLVLKPFSRLRS